MEKDIVKSISLYWYSKCWKTYRDGAAGIYMSANGQGAKREAKGCQQLQEGMGLTGCISGERLPLWGIKIHPWRQLPFLIAFSKLYRLQRFMPACYRCAGTKIKASHADPRTQVLLQNVHVPSQWSCSNSPSSHSSLL